MGVEKTIEFLLQSQAQLEAAQGRFQESLGALAGVVRDLALAQMRTDERVHELVLLQKQQAQLQKEQALRQQDQAESLKQTRENLDTLVRVVDDLVRRNGRH